jgi:hypothetical protein
MQEGIYLHGQQHVLGLDLSLVVPHLHTKLISLDLQESPKFF